MMYGLESSSDAESQGRVILCGRPIDCQTLWYHGYPAMSLAKGVGWKEADAEKLANIPDIFVVLPTGVDEEEDLREAFKNSKLRDRVKLVRMGGEAPNPSELHKQDPNGFRERMDALIEGASALIDEVERERIAAAAQALEQCCELARQQSIPNSFVASIRARGVVGEERLCQLLFLALVSRLLKRPISIAVKGPSSGGKSFVLEQILRYFPSSAYFTLSAMSEHYLAYTEESFVHRHLVLLEATGMNKDMVSYLIRSLLSEGCIRYATLEKTSEGIRERLLVHEGPTGLMVTTTLPSLHPENETRMISATVTDTQDQTRAVFHAIADETADDDAQELEQWHALQRWLELAGRRQVTIPFAHILAELIPAVAVRLRRDFSSLLNLIRAHALLHQATRELDERGRIVATIEDYVAVRSLVADLIADEVGATVSKATREAVAAVRDLQGYGREGASNRQVAQLLSIDTSSALRRLRVAAKKGYVRNLETRRGAQAKWVPGDVMPEDEDLLPSPETLEACMVAPPTEGLEYPPSPAGDGSEARPKQARRRVSLLPIEGKNMNAATVIRSCRGAGYRVVLLSGQVFFPPLHPGMCAPLPEELKEAARQRSEDLVVRLTWEGRAETLINESHQRLNAVESFPRDGWLEETPFWLRYEDDLDEAFMAGDMDSLKALLDEREEMVAEMYGV